MCKNLKIIVIFAGLTSAIVISFGRVERKMVDASGEQRYSVSHAENMQIQQPGEGEAAHLFLCM